MSSLSPWRTVQPHDPRPRVGGGQRVEVPQVGRAFEQHLAAGAAPQQAAQQHPVVLVHLPHVLPAEPGGITRHAA